MFARGKLLHLCSALVKALSSVQFCDQTLGRAQGLVGFRAQGLTGFHTQKLVWFMLRNFWFCFQRLVEFCGLIMEQAQVLVGVQFLGPCLGFKSGFFSPLGPGLRSSQGQPFLSLAHFALHLKAQHLFSWFYPATPWKWLLISLSVSYIQSQDCDSLAWWHRTWAGLRLL